ncbi:hypothetical protein M2323_001546 [Rhodoblastus acidophilus]|uniref:hypothetical protein n=1 Tax=Rhodoblastus acidophilus TaxID=1074 RepID=UPI002224A0C9|nr:hypothetical protein [Rhodoblastus acidophilus]MCW2283937.1 hypothetical protein [Rhodoblastus acidophilus]MCW2332633.1 hypothetical protein [Rhodoblastus acidophilus]
MPEFDRDFTSEPSITRFPPKAAPGAAPKTPPGPSPAPASLASDSPLAPEAYAPPATCAVRLARFVEVAGAAPTPFALGLLAPAGGGKTSALGWVEARAQKQGGLVVARFEAADLAADPERALAAGLYRALAPTQSALVAVAAREAEEASATSHTQDRLDDLRKKLIAERQALADHQERRAALPETVLYDLPGTQVDTFARRMRGGFEARMQAFGLSGDPLLAFKDFTRDLAALDGTRARIFACLRSLYAYKGQTSLLVYAVLLYLLAQGLDWASLHKADWLGWLSRTHEAGAQTAEYLRDRLGPLDAAATLATWLALFCIGLNLWRAYAFSAPLLRAAKKLDEDVAARAPEADEAVASQARVVERLAAQTAAAKQQAAEAERRAESAGALAPAFLERDAAGQKREQALALLSALSAGLAKKGGRAVVIVDGFEKVLAGGALLERLAHLLARPGLVSIFALDPALCDASSQARLLQLPLRLNAGAFDSPSYAPLDASLSALEERMLVSLAPLVGDTPRAKKRLRNFYLFLRPARGADDKLAPVLAFAIATEMAGGAEREALETLVAGGHPDVARAPLFADMLKATQDIGGPLEAENLRRAVALARVVAG